MKKILFSLFVFGICAAAAAQGNFGGDSLTVNLQDSLTVSGQDSAFWRSFELNEIVVKSTLPKTRLRGDAMTTRIAGSVLEKAGSATQLLAHIPMLEVKGTAVSVTGRGAAEVYINGRKVRDTKELAKLQSDQVMKVEVVQNPGARYAAETKAVVRITLKRPTGEGFGFTEIAQFQSQHGEEWSNDLDLNYRRGGLDLGAQLYYMDTGLGESSRSEQMTSLDKVWRLVSVDDSKMKMRAWVPTLTLNFQPADNQSMGARWQWFKQPTGETVGSSYSQLFCGEDFIEDNLALPGGKDHGWSHDVGLYYSGKLAGFQIDANYDWYKEKMLDATETTETQEGGEPSAVHTYSLTKNEMHAAKIIAARPFLGGELTFGGEGTLTTRRNEYQNPEGLVADDDSRVEEDIFAGFIEFSREVGRFSLHAGLRYEHTRSDYFKDGLRQAEQCRRYNDLFPSAGITTEVGQTSLQLLYSSEIVRPSYFNLSSATWYMNRYTYMSENPLLRPTYTNSLSLTAACGWLTATVGYKRIKDEEAMMTRPVSVEKPQVSLQTSENIAPYNQGYATLILQPRIGLWSPTWELSAFIQDYEAETPDGRQRLSKPYATIDWQNVLELGKGWRIAADIHYMSKGNMSNGELLRHSLHADLGLLKTLLRDRLELRLDARDLFRSRRDHLMTFSGLRTTIMREDAHRGLTVSMKYKFNAAGEREQKSSLYLPSGSRVGKANAAKSKNKGEGAGESQKNRMKGGK